MTYVTEVIDGENVLRGESSVKTEGEIRAELARSHNERGTVAEPADTTDAYAKKVAKRPDGMNLRLAGAIMILGAVLAGGLAWSLPDVTNAAYVSIGVAPTFNIWKWPTIWLSGAAAQLGVLLWLTGTIVQALFFLPGRDVANGEFLS